MPLVALHQGRALLPAAGSRLRFVVNTFQGMEMTERDGIFAGSDPFEIAARWLGEAEKTESNDPNAIALATVDAPRGFAIGARILTTYPSPDSVRIACAVSGLSCDNRFANRPETRLLHEASGSTA